MESMREDVEIRAGDMREREEEFQTGKGQPSVQTELSELAIAELEIEKAAEKRTETMPLKRKRGRPPIIGKQEFYVTVASDSVLRKRKKKTFSIDEMFCGIPELKRIFKRYERQIANYEQYEWSAGTSKEKLIKKRDLLLETVKNMNNVDLLILFYVQNIDRLGKFNMLEMLRDLYQAQCEYNNKFFGADEQTDFFDVGNADYKRK